jgi:hypothetical protein
MNRTSTPLHDDAASSPIRVAAASCALVSILAAGCDGANAPKPVDPPGGSTARQVVPRDRGSRPPEQPSADAEAHRAALDRLRAAPPENTRPAVIELVAHGPSALPGVVAIAQDEPHDPLIEKLFHDELLPDAVRAVCAAILVGRAPTGELPALLASDERLLRIAALTRIDVARSLGALGKAARGMLSELRFLLTTDQVTDRERPAFQAAADQIASAIHDWPRPSACSISWSSTRRRTAASRCSRTSAATARSPPRRGRRGRERPEAEPSRNCTK